MLTYDDLPRYTQAALHLENAAFDKGEACVKWLLITDEPGVVKWFFDGAIGKTALEKARFRQVFFFGHARPIVC